jgi:intein/homing endonuclease
VKPALTRHKKQLNQWQTKAKELTTYLVESRDNIVKHIFKYKDNAVVSSPVAFAYTISNVQGQMNLNKDSVVDLTLLEAATMIDETYVNLEKIHGAVPTPLFKTLYTYYLSPKDLLLNKRFNRTALTLLLENIVLNYKKAIVAPGEMVGMIAAQSIGEPTTQMSLPYHEKVRIVKVDKATRTPVFLTTPIGKLCDQLIQQNPASTMLTGHGPNSVETQIDQTQAAAGADYYVVGVDSCELTSWNKISHVSRHPVNGQLMRVTTKSGRSVETTTSHSHLVRSAQQQKVVPMVGADLQKGMRIPVCKYVYNAFETSTTRLLDTIQVALDFDFGQLLGTFLHHTHTSNSNNAEDQALVDEFCATYAANMQTQTHIDLESVKPYFATLLKSHSVPDYMFHAPESCKAGFLRAYFDIAGQFQDNKLHHQIRISSRHRQFINDISTLLSHFGILPYINSQSSSKTIHMYIAAKYAPLYQEKIGSTKHAETLASIVAYATRADAHDLSEEIDKINGLGIIIAHCGAALKLQGHSRNYGRWAKKDSIGRRTLEKYIHIFEEADAGKNIIQTELAILKQAAESNVVWDEIVDIEIWTPDAQDYVYDFTVPGNQTFMVDNGIIVHNTLNSVTYETHIIVRDRAGLIQKVQIGEFIEKHIANPKKLEYYKDKDTTYAEMNEYFEVPSCTEDGDVVWKEIEAVTRHPVINKDGTNTMIKVTTEENREVIATKAKSFLKLVNGKLIAYEGENLKVGDYVPISTKQIEFTELRTLDLRDILPPTEYIYASEVEKAKAVMGKNCWWSKHIGSTFVLPYKRSDTFVAKVSEKLRSGCNTKTMFQPGCVYTLQTNMNDYMIPEAIPLDYNFGYLCGAYAAEGCMTKFQVSIANNDTEYFGPILELCKQWNINTKVYRHENKGKEGWTSQDLRIYNTVLCRILEKFCGKLSHHKFVIDKIVYSNKDCILGFLDAYIGGDGTVDIKQKVISMSSVSKELLIDVQQMLNIIGNYSYITKYKKPESNNRGTLPENIRQMYNLRITGSQLYLLIPQLNIRLKYKQENLVELLKHEYKYDIHKIATLIPNEIDGEIVIEERMDGKYTDVLFDKIASIEAVENTTNYAYDLTVKDTRTFLLHNGMLVFDTFHFAGVSSKSNVTRGVPRIEEILSLSSEPKNPSLTVFLKPEEQTDREKAQSIMYMLEHTKLKELVISSEICFDPDDLNTLIADDEQAMEQYRAFENMVDECAGIQSGDSGEPNQPNEDKSKWVVRIEMEPNMLLEKNITMDDIHFTLTNSYGEDISCVYSDYNADKLVFRIRMNNILKTGKGSKKIKVNPLDQSDHIYLLKNFQDQLLDNLIIRGIKHIDKVILRKIKDNLTEKSGVYQKEDIWVLDTVGTNILDVLALDYVDYKRTFSNDIIEIFEVFGIEAARQIIYNELVEVIEFDGTYINFHHLALLCDRMTSTSKLISIFRHGINNDNIGPIAKASFEETPEMFLKAARHGELDIMRGVSANVMCGQEGMFGTNAFQVVLDMEEMRKLEETVPNEKTALKTSIDALFGQIENPDDACSTNRLMIQNNVAALKTKKVADINDYNPGF